MNRQELSRKLVDCTSKERKPLLIKHKEICDSSLAEQLQQICYEVWTSEPQKVSSIVETLREIYHLTNDTEIIPYTEWTEAIRNLVNGKLENCIEWLDRSETSFKNSGNIHAAATTQTSKIYALALLGRYDEAVACGLRARDVFISENDIYSTGKIEHNIGNLFWRRDLYRESEPYLSSAHERFTQVGDQRQLAMVENCQAFVKALQNDFSEAENIYARAVKRAEENNLTVTQAEIEIGLSNLYLFQGRLDPALEFMESSRQKYDHLEMPHQTANCELEIADIYLELNLLPEAIEFYEKVETKFSELGMQAELARSFLNHAKALLLLSENERSAQLLEKAQKLYYAEGNEISAASINLVKAQLLIQNDHFDQAESEIIEALKCFKKGGNVRYEIFSQWLRGEIMTYRKENATAKRIYAKTLERAKGQSRQVEYLCLISLGKLTGEEKFYLEAVKLVENSRAALSSEDFRTAFFADKVQPFNELTKIKLSRNKPLEAFIWHERSRSRSLFEAISSVPSDHLETAKLNDLRGELNWFYNRINRQKESGLGARKEIVKLRKHAEKIEKEFAEAIRRLQINDDFAIREFQEFDLQNLQKHLKETTLVEFVKLDGKFSAFVITDKIFEFYEISADEEFLQTEIGQFLFQIKTARFQEKLSAENREIAFSRMLHHSQNIYELLLKPIEKFCYGRRLKIIPADILHYLPFQALHNGEKFLIETNEISYAPSAAIFQNCLNRNSSVFDNALLIGVADNKTPFIKTEIETLGELFSNSVKCFNEKATLENLCKNIEKADILHFACHGNFRPDNPEFSSLSLFAENLTVKQVQNLALENKFVTLSACETGLNKIVSGEELIGLTHGFLSAGASSLLLSLWAVNDTSTLNLMKKFYRKITDGESPGKALQNAQIKALNENKHPYFWSPFILIGK